MKTLGLIGGLSWESTAIYYRIINNEVRDALGGIHSARLLLYSFDMEDIAALQRAGDWTQAAHRLAQAGIALKAAGADMLVICTNTMHIVADEVEKATGLPLVHIIDCTGEEIQKQGLDTIGLLGTQFTMEQPFYRNRLKDKFGIDLVVPELEDRQFVHQVIFGELCKGVINPDSRQRYLDIIGHLKEQGAQAIILGCTEICLLLDAPEYAGLGVFDSTLIHAKRAARYALQGASILEAA